VQQNNAFSKSYQISNFPFEKLLELNNVETITVKIYVFC